MEEKEVIEVNENPQETPKGKKKWNKKRTIKVVSISLVAVLLIGLCGYFAPKYTANDLFETYVSKKYMNGEKAKGSLYTVYEAYKKGYITKQDAMDLMAVNNYPIMYDLYGNIVDYKTQRVELDVSELDEKVAYDIKVANVVRSKLKPLLLEKIGFADLISKTKIISYYGKYSNAYAVFIYCPVDNWDYFLPRKKYVIEDIVYEETTDVTRQKSIFVYE